MRGISLVAEELLGSLEGLCFMDLVFLDINLPSEKYACCSFLGFLKIKFTAVMALLRDGKCQLIGC
jgi:hypothetical protein